MEKNFFERPTQWIILQIFNELKRISMELLVVEYISLTCTLKSTTTILSHGRRISMKFSKFCPALDSESNKSKWLVQKLCWCSFECSIEGKSGEEVIWRSFVGIQLENLWQKPKVKNMQKYSVSGILRTRTLSKVNLRYPLLGGILTLKQKTNWQWK